MNQFISTLIVGIIFGTIDILPMLKMKLDKYSILSAFVFYLVSPFIIYHTNLFSNVWWVKGGLLNLLLALPVIILVSKDGIKSTLPIIVMSIILGSLIGITGHILLKT